MVMFMKNRVFADAIPRSHVACVAGVGRGRKEERRAREGREDR